MPYVRELKTDTKVRGFLHKLNGKFYRVTSGIVSFHRQGCVIHESNKMGKVINYSNELHFTTNLDHEAAFAEFENKLKPELKPE